MSIMNPITQFFVDNIIEVYFFYGLAFFTMGLALALASRRTSELSFARAIGPLAVFGLLHGAHEWVEMFQQIAAVTDGYQAPVSHEIMRLLLLIVSFVALDAFGIVLLRREAPNWRRVAQPLGLLVGVWAISVLMVQLVAKPTLPQLVALADVLGRYVLAMPGAVIGAWAMMSQQHEFRDYGMPQFGRNLVWCATALLLYGVLGQIFVRQTALFPSTVINTALFLRWFGIPVQLFRGMMAALWAFFMVRTLEAFKLESRLRLVKANEARLQALHQVVNAQESERQRVARELHDATGQSLTAIALGLRGVETLLATGTAIPATLLPQVRELKNFSTDAIGELRQIIADLRPALLDDMGLEAALDWYIQDFQRRHNIRTFLDVQGSIKRLPSEYETVLFRITQEALTNVAKHARASQVTVQLEMAPTRVSLVIEDDGIGFDARKLLASNASRTAWGLLGIQERTILMGGDCSIIATPGHGTLVEVKLPVLQEVTHD